MVRITGRPEMISAVYRGSQLFTMDVKEARKQTKLHLSALVESN